MITNVMERLIDFTRTSGGGYFGPDGLFRFTPASRNLLTFTQEFDNAAWSKSNSTITANSTAAPDGTMTADTLVEDAKTAAHLMSQTQTLSATPYTASVYLKAKERGFALFSQGAVNGISVNLSTGAVASAVGSPTNIASTNAGNGWWRVSFTFTPSAGSTPLNVCASTDGVWANRSYAGSTSSGIFVWGTQLELGSTPTTYTRNVGGVYPPRFDYDPVTLAPRGLLIEERRTNLLLRSEEFDNSVWAKENTTVTANSTASPDGTVDADTLNEGTASGVHSIAQVFSATTGTSYALSVYLKNGDARYAQLFFGSAGHGSTAFANFDLQSGTVGTVGATATASIQSAGGGWYRCTIVAAATATTASASAQIGVITSNTSTRAENYTGASKFIYVWGAQLEAGAFATSYIPTVASQVTRASDVAVITGANFSQWFNAAEGTLLIECSVQLGATRYLFAGTDSQRMAYCTSGGAFGIFDGAHAATPTPTSGLASGQRFKLATSYSVSAGLAGSVDGSAVSTSSSYTGSFATMTSVGLFNIGAGTSPATGHLRRIRYHPTRLSNAQLQALTA